MKKLIYLMFAIVAIVFSACKDDNDKGENIAFERQEYKLTAGTIIVKLIVNQSPAQATELPVTFGGTAKLNEDYTVSATKYVVGGSQQMLAIEVTAKNNFQEAKTITMTLSGASSATTTIRLNPRDKYLYTFAQRDYVMGNEAEITLKLQSSRTGEDVAADNDITISIAADESKSTAVEGTHFEFINKTATIKQGTTGCVFKLKALKMETGKDKIVIKSTAGEADGFLKGRFPEANIKILGSYVNDLFGTWVMDTIITDTTYMKNMWAGAIPDKEFLGLPKFKKSDTFTFIEDGKGGYVLKTTLESEFKNYFRPESPFSFDQEYKMRTGMAGKIAMQLLRLTNVNRYFSPTELSSDKEALLGLRNVKTDDGKVLLDVYLIDYESRSFFQSFPDYGMYDPTKPTASSSGLFLNFLLKKKE